MHVLSPSVDEFAGGVDEFAEARFRARVEIVAHLSSTISARHDTIHAAYRAFRPSDRSMLELH